MMMMYGHTFVPGSSQKHSISGYTINSGDDTDISGHIVWSASGPHQGCSPKKEVGGRLKQDLDKDFFKQFRPTYTFTHTREKKCHSASLVSSCDTATRV